MVLEVELPLVAVAAVEEGEVAVVAAVQETRDKARPLMLNGLAAYFDWVFARYRERYSLRKQILHASSYYLKIRWLVESLICSAQR